MKKSLPRTLDTGAFWVDEGKVCAACSLAGEWNAANIFLEWYLFGLNSCAPCAFLAAPPPPLAAFLLASQYFAPVLGNLRPDSMSYLLAPLLDLQRPLTESLIPSSIRSYLLAIRNYSGNHATHIFAAKASAPAKLLL